MRSYYRLVIWSVIWAILWPITALFKKKDQHNCVTWAVEEWEKEEDSYVVIRWCRTSKVRWIRWPHFLHLSADRKELRDLVPKDTTDLDRHLVPAMWFDGKMRKDDPVDSREEN